MLLPFLSSLLTLFLVFFTIFLVARTLFESALSPHGYNCCSVSWKKEKKKKSRWKIEVEGNKENGLCSCPFLFLFSPGKRREKFLLRYLIEKRGGSRCLPDVSDASVPLATTIYGRKSTMWLPRFQIYRDFETCQPRARRSPRCFFF